MELTIGTSVGKLSVAMSAEQLGTTLSDHILQQNPGAVRNVIQNPFKRDQVQTSKSRDLDLRCPATGMLTTPVIVARNAASVMMQYMILVWLGAFVID